MNHVEESWLIRTEEITKKGTGKEAAKKGTVKVRRDCNE